MSVDYRTEDEIAVVTIDRPEVLRPSLDDPDLPYTLLSDSKLNATRAFGLLLQHVLDDVHPVLVVVVVAAV